MKEIQIVRDTVLNQQYVINDLYRYNLEKNKTYYIVTFGCQMNEHDSEKMMGLLELCGFSKAESEESADVVIFNTCAVRENAELKIYGNIGRIKKIKEKREVILGLCGCMMQQSHIIDKIKKSYPYVDIIFGTHNYHELPMYINEVLFNKNKIINLIEDSTAIIEDLPSKRKKGVKAYVNIMQGCNNFCTFCIVPYTRGREKSRDYKDVIREIKDLVNTGVKEVTLLGQNVNSYSGGISFAELLEEINKIEGLERIRFMTSHPKDISDEVINKFGKLDKLCEYLHLPVQSGSNQILKRMNRRYTHEAYLEKINKLKSNVPHMTFSTDIIIGFPGEKEEDVDRTIDLIREVEYDSAFTFIYSKRVGTPAATFEDDVTDEEKHIRFEKMLNALNEIVIRKNSERVGNTYEVLVESVDMKRDYATGRSRENHLISFNANSVKEGDIVNVKITNAKKFSLEGEII